MPARSCGPIIWPWEARLIQSPIRKVLSSIQKHRVQALLMGGQACILYGAAEFSRDTDLAILASPENLQRLREALAELEAAPIAVPPFELQYLERGLAVHFRCFAPGCERVRLDVMSKMRGVDDFEQLWARRTSLASPDVNIDLLSLPDLVAAKKTQRAKDWPMIARLLEASYFQRPAVPTPEQIRFWLRELRTPALLVGAVSAFSAEASALQQDRPLLRYAMIGDHAALHREILEEQLREQDLDRQYWQPLKAELERLRREMREKDAGG
jgi:hypothetical protein